MQWWHFISLGIRHCSHARLPALAVTLQFGQSWCSTVSVSPMRMGDVSGARVCPAELLFVVHQMAEFLGWLPGVTQKKMWNPCACQLHWFSPLCVCVYRWTVMSEPNVTMCVFLWCSLNWTAAVPTMLPGSGVGVLPFTVNPITPTGSTNCDTGTTTLHCSHSKWFFGILTLSDSFTCTSSFVWMCAMQVYFCVCVVCVFIFFLSLFNPQNNITLTTSNLSSRQYVMFNIWSNQSFHTSCETK